MKPSASKKRFLQRIVDAGYSLDALPVAGGIDAMLLFYDEERAEQCNLEEDGDMLLFQWGCNDWGKGEFFEVNITRQFMDATGEDETIRQLSLTYRFEPNEKLRKIGDGNKWCDYLDKLAAFRKFIHSSAAFKSVSKLIGAKVQLELVKAG